jgi:hypothetical protein
VNFVILYRPPNSGHENVSELCKILRDLKKETIVVGDFNLPEINWEAEQSGARGRPVLEAALDQQLVQLIDFATHVKGELLNWVEEWLAGRTQRVAVEGVLSEEEEVKSGVPQENGGRPGYHQ